ncbi:MAG: lipocalin family protein [Leptospirales bacterium]
MRKTGLFRLGLLGSFLFLAASILIPAMASPRSVSGEEHLSSGDWMTAHPGYSIEWWYLTGRLHLAGKSQSEGFEGTFFRFETGYRHPPGLPSSPWEPRNVLSFHGAFTDPSRKLFQWTETMGRTFRKSVSLRPAPLKILFDANRLVFHQDLLHPGRFSLHLVEQVKDRVLDLTLNGHGDPLWEGKGGKLVTGPGPDDWAWYLTYPSLSVSGRIGRVSHGTISDWKAVDGVAWFDHEWTHAMLGQGQTGWIWLGGRMRTGARLMAFEMQRHGRPDRFRGGTFRKKGDSPVWLGPEGVRFRVLSTWRSPHTGRCYPHRILITLPGQKKRFLIRPVIPDQELGGSPSYWEGAVRILDPVSEKPVGEGYLELTGFVRLAQGRCLVRQR